MFIALGIYKIFLFEMNIFLLMIDIYILCHPHILNNVSHHNIDKVTCLVSLLCVHWTPTFFNF